MLKDEREGWRRSDGEERIQKAGMYVGARLEKREFENKSSPSDSYEDYLIAIF